MNIEEFKKVAEEAIIGAYSRGFQDGQQKPRQVFVAVLSRNDRVFGVYGTEELARQSMDDYGYPPGDYYLEPRELDVVSIRSDLGSIARTRAMLNKCKETTTNYADVIRKKAKTDPSLAATINNEFKPGETARAFLDDPLEARRLADAGRKVILSVTDHFLVLLVKVDQCFEGDAGYTVQSFLRADSPLAESLNPWEYDGVVYDIGSMEIEDVLKLTVDDHEFAVRVTQYVPGGDKLKIIQRGIDELRGY